MLNKTLKEVISESYGKATKNMVFVTAESYATSFFDKLKEQVNKKEYILFTDAGKIHILTISTKKNTLKVTEEVVFSIDDLEDISLTNIGSQKNPKAKVLGFTAPSGETIMCMIPYTTKKILHEKQSEHLDDLVELLMPTT